MPIAYQDYISRSDLRSHPERLYVFGDNELRKGRKGQAAACRGEPNAVGIATKRAPGTDPGDFWSDRELRRIVRIIDGDLARIEAHLATGGLVVFPKAGIGTGLAELPSRAPAVFRYLSGCISVLAESHGVVPFDLPHTQRPASPSLG